MKRIAIVGGGIAGVCAAYELARQQQAGAQVEFFLFESANWLGGIVETERRDGFIFECGPDGWVTEKPDARTLAMELGLESEIVFPQDTRRKTYIAQGSTLIAMPDGMRMMVPSRWSGVLRSRLFSARAKLAYFREPGMAERLKAAALANASYDESVRDFVFRHFGPEVADKVAAPLLAGVFGGNISSLSARAVLPAYVEMEREYGSLITALRKRRRTGDARPMFSTLRNGLAGLIEKMASHIPPKNIRLGRRVNAIENTGDAWHIHSASNEPGNASANEVFDAVLVATPAEATKQLLGPLDAAMAGLLPDKSSSSVVVNLAFASPSAQAMQIPRGFGFLVPQAGGTESTDSDSSLRKPDHIARRSLLACTFVDQKFPHRAPSGARLLRAFFGGPNVRLLMSMDDSQIVSSTLAALERFLGRLSEPSSSVIRRLPNSLPLYPVGHLGRIAELETRLTKFPHLRLIGNAYQGVGLPDVIRTSRSAVREMLADLIDWRVP
jgi:protoporphyrinogen/coproporphyrinogen III oxidase